MEVELPCRCSINLPNGYSLFYSITYQRPTWCSQTLRQSVDNMVSTGLQQHEVKLLLQSFSFDRSVGQSAVLRCFLGAPHAVKIHSAVTEFKDLGS